MPVFGRAFGRSAMGSPLLAFILAALVMAMAGGLVLLLVVGRDSEPTTPPADPTPTTVTGDDGCRMFCDPPR